MDFKNKFLQYTRLILGITGNMTILQFFAILLIGNMTTQPWNLFINNQGYFVYKLNGSPPKPAEKNMTFPEMQKTCLTKNGLNCTDQNPDLLNTTSIENCTYLRPNSKNETTISTEFKACLRKKQMGVEDSSFAVFWSTMLTSVSLSFSFISANVSAFIVRILPLNMRVYGVFTIIGVVFLAMILFAWSVYNIISYFTITLISAGIIIFTANIFQATSFSIVGPMHFMYVVTLMEGQALGGIFISLVKMGCDKIEDSISNGSSTGSHAKEIAVTIYWLVGFILLILTWLGFKFVFVRSQDYLNSLSVKEKNSKPLLKTSKSTSTKSITTLEILNIIKIPALCEGLNFFVCLAIFPAVLVQLRSNNDAPDIFGLRPVSFPFVNFAVFLIFNLGDWIGKKCGKFAFSADRQYLLLFITLLRLLYFPLVFSLNLSGEKEGIFASNYYSIIVVFTFALSSGYLGCIAMRFAPEILSKKVKKQNLYSEDQITLAQNKVGPIMIIFIILGLLLGSLFSAVPTMYLTKRKDEVFEEQFSKLIEKLSNTTAV